MLQEVVRVGDMHHNRKLKIFRQGDGDIQVMIVQDGIPVQNDAVADEIALVEFCTHAGGGRSSRTFQALLTLMKAMEEDNKERPIQ